ncbi:hypothetical protein DFP93_1312 [Aneurinibacillus soli]|uniref:Uncharacterized protein n=1 Tax=Aneurinibacillus soli TaxID=1500254 RepID=A0A0U5AYC9_9BACL|nr:hypothetical protein [Aneurinibacillus soli]PYE57365.1 hypothetical protein DFP93_1312 [Aneurinibacillus soli]BAU28762.1 hypothetical protein CB4_02939 [Aneurinibacillus soli]
MDIKFLERNILFYEINTDNVSGFVSAIKESDSINIEGKEYELSHIQLRVIDSVPQLLVFVDKTTIF